MSIQSVLNWLETNFASIVLALLIAMMVWIIAVQEANPVEQAPLEDAVPIHVQGLQSDWVITNNPRLSTTVHLRAPALNWQTLSADDVTATIDVSELGPGSHEVPIRIEVNAQAALVSANPPEIHIEIEELLERTLPVQLSLTDELPAGYRADTPIYSPEEVTIQGPRSRTLLVGEVRATISLNTLRADYEATVPLVALDNNGIIINDVNITPANISITLPIVQEAGFREVAVRVNANVQPATGYYVSRITSNPPQISVHGEPDIIDGILFIETQPITLQGITQDTSVNIQLEPIEGVTFDEVQTVEVLFTIEAAQGFRALEIPVQAVGLDEETYQATLLPSVAVISLSGPLPILDALNEDEDIIVTVDLLGLEEGSYQIEPELEIVSGTIPAEDLQQLVRSVLPTLIEVEIEPLDTDGS